MKIAYIAQQKIHFAEADRQEETEVSQLQPHSYGQAFFSEQLFQLKEEIQGILSQIEENIDFK